MEFPEIFVLDIVLLCFIIVTLIVGFTALALIRFSLKDKLLARNILATIIIAMIFPFLFMIGELVWTISVTPQCCPSYTGFVNSHFSELASTSFSFALLLVVPSLTVGFLIAFFIILPITIFLRHIKKKEIQGIGH